jgi:hypothetical protein
MRGTKLVLGVLMITLAFSGCLSDDGASAGANVGNKVKGGKAAAAPDLSSFVATLPDGTLVDPSLLAGVPPLSGVQSFIGSESYEPTLGIHPKSGAVFMSNLDFKGPNGLPRGFVRMTADHGATWKDVSPKLPTESQANPPVSFDPFVVSDPVTGRIFTADLQALVCNWLSFTDDEGKTWTTNPVGCGMPPGVHDHQSLITGKSRGTPSTYNGRMVYYCVNRIGDSSCAASNNGGLAFGPLVPVMLGFDQEAGAFCGGLHGHVKTDNAGRVLLPKNQCGIPTLGVSEDDGKTWKTYKVSSVGSRKSGTGDLGDHELAVAADAADNLYALWIGENGLPHLAISRDHGAKWTPARVVSPPGVTAADKPAIYASAEGKVAFAYIGSSIENGYSKKPACVSRGQNQPPDCSARDKAWANATWNAYIGVITDAFAEKPIVLTTTVNDPADPIAIKQCGGTRCGGLYDFIDVEIDSEGRPWAALVDVCHEKCVADFAKDPMSAKHDVNRGFAGTLATGPALRAEGGALPSLAWVTAAAPLAT